MPGMDKTLAEWKSGKLKSSSGDKVTSQKQAIAIGLSEERAAGKKVPPPPKHHQEGARHHVDNPEHHQHAAATYGK